MADINLEIQPSTKVKVSKINPENSLSLTLQNPTSGSATKVRFHVPASDEENPSDGGPKSGPPPADKPKPKGKKSRLALILKIMAAVIIVIGVTNFFLWVVVNPRKMKFYVTNAELTEFSLSEYDNTLRYNLRLNFTVRNPNKRIGFRYESIVAGAYYEGEKFESGNLFTFSHPPKSTSVLDTWFLGARTLSLDMDAVREFKEHEGSGVYPIDVKIRVYSSIKLGKLSMGDFKVKIKCGLKVPIITAQNYGGDWKSSSTSTFTGFKTTQCHVDFNPLIVNYSD